MVLDLISPHIKTFLANSMVKIGPIVILGIFYFSIKYSTWLIQSPLSSSIHFVFFSSYLTYIFIFFWSYIMCLLCIFLISK